MSSSRVPISPSHSISNLLIVFSACDVVNPIKLGRLLYLSVMQHIFCVKHPGIDLSAPITMDEVGRQQVHSLFQFAFRGSHGKDRKILRSFRDN